MPTYTFTLPYAASAETITITDEVSGAVVDTIAPAATSGALSTLVREGSEVVITANLNVGEYVATAVDTESWSSTRFSTEGVLDVPASLQAFPTAVATDVADTNTAIGGALASVYAKHVYNMDFQHLKKWTKALGNVRNGASDAKILVVGDSTADGIGGSTAATLPTTKAWPSRLAELMNSQMCPSAVGLGTPKSSSAAQAADNRWTGGTNWSLNPVTVVNMGFGGKSKYWRATGVTAGNLVYADTRVTADTFDIYYRRQPGSFSTGTFDVTATGGSTTTVDAALAGGVTRIEKVTVSAASASTSNTVTITGKTASKTIDIVGIEPYLSTTKKVRIGNGSATGSATVDWVSYYQATSANSYAGLEAIAGYAPDLTIIDLGINDAGNAVPLATYIANMNLIIAAAQLSGDVILKTPIPSGGTASARTPFETQYVEWMMTRGLPVIDIYNRVVNYDTYFAAGFMSSDGIHGNDFSYLDEAAFILDALRRI